MTPERWEQVERLYHAAIEIESGQRTAFLAEACGGDEELRREVVSLLAAHDEAGSLIVAPALEVVAREWADKRVGTLVQDASTRTIDHFQILSLLGRGGMGEVYLAEDTRLERRVALKLLPAEFTADADRLRRFTQEAKAASALNHPNILTVHEIGRADGAHYIVTEFIDGQTLRERMQAAKLSLNEVLDVAIQVAKALEAAHAAGIVHRDIKPENVMARRDGLGKVLDVGLAKLTEERQGDKETRRRGDKGTRGQGECPFVPLSPPPLVSSSLSLPLSSTGVVMGTPRYMSPEQARGEELDARSDLFSFGVMLYEMATGGAPFSGETPAALFAELLKDEPPPVRELNPGLPAKLEQIIGKALKKDREARYQSAEKLLADLRLASSDVSSGRPAAGSLASARLPKLKWLIAGMALLVVAAVLIYAWRASRPQSRIRSLAVLPFKSLDARNDDQALGLRLTDALITKLSDGLPRVVVRSTSAMRKYDDASDPIAAGREQQVDAVLEASFQRAGDRLRVTARLLSVGDHRQLWAGKFDERVADPFALQDALTEQAALALLPQLTGEERSRIKKHDTRSAEAFDLYWIGRVHWNKRTTEGLKQAVESLQQAISLDPDYAVAHAGLADAWITLSEYEVIPSKEAYPKAREAAAKAIALDESLAEAHTSLAMISASHDWNWGKAEASFRRALALNPNYPTAHQWYAEYLAAMGRPAEALDQIGQAQQLDPASMVVRAARAWILYHARDYDAMIAECRKIIGMEPGNLDAYVYLARAYEQKAMYREAMDAWSKYITLAGLSTPEGEAIRASSSRGSRGIRDHDDYWRKRELLERMPSVEVFNLAETVAQLGGNDEAMQLLEQCFAARDSHLMYLKVHPNLDRLRSDPRFAGLVRRMQLAP